VACEVVFVWALAALHGIFARDVRTFAEDDNEEKPPFLSVVIDLGPRQ